LSDTVTYWYTNGNTDGDPDGITNGNTNGNTNPDGIAHGASDPVRGRP
jgi:hypothetical protein